MKQLYFIPEPDYVLLYDDKIWKILSRGDVKTLEDTNELTLYITEHDLRLLEPHMPKSAGLELVEVPPGPWEKQLAESLGLEPTSSFMSRPLGMLPGRPLPLQLAKGTPDEYEVIASFKAIIKMWGVQWDEFNSPRPPGDSIPPLLTFILDKL